MAVTGVLIAPSLLACDFGRMAAEVQRCVEAGADVLHLDLMDGHFVPNLSFGFPLIESLAREFPNLPLDVHLMVSNPDTYLSKLLELGAWQITVHWEAVDHLHRLLGEIRKGGAKAGVAFNPHTPVEQAEYLVDQIDCYLIMTVNPGFGGQSFLRSQLPKIEKARALAEKGGLGATVAVDGGVDDRTAPVCLKAGADLLVAGSYLFKLSDMKSGIEALRADVAVQS
ncbi:MAG: ribulose-phosphate 3-epimerase [Vulcanimicrobiota bacterium]